MKMPLLGRKKVKSGIETGEPDAEEKLRPRTWIRSMSHCYKRFRRVTRRLTFDCRRETAELAAHSVELMDQRQYHRHRHIGLELTGKSYSRQTCSKSGPRSPREGAIQPGDSRVSVDAFVTSSI